jgi:hypothetical protein
VISAQLDLVVHSSPSSRFHSPLERIVAEARSSVWSPVYRRDTLQPEAGLEKVLCPADMTPAVITPGTDQDRQTDRHNTTDHELN